MAAVPAAVAGAADWSEQHEQQMRVGVVHATGNLAAMALYGASLLARRPRLGRALRLAGLAVVSVSGLAGGHISFRLAGGANHAEPVPHLIERGWHHLSAAADLPEGNRCATCWERFRSWPSGPTAPCMSWPTGAATCLARCPTASSRTAA